MATSMSVIYGGESPLETFTRHQYPFVANIYLAHYHFSFKIKKNKLYTTFKHCNKFECFWDGHDCDDTPPKSAYYIDKRASYHQRHGLL